MPVIGRRRSRTLLFIGVGVVLLVVLSANSLTGLLTDWWWYDSVGAGRLWRAVTTTQLVMVLGFGMLFAAILWGNLFLADRLAPPWRLTGDEDDVIERYQQTLAVHSARIRLVLAVGFGVVAGLNSASRWSMWMLFRNGGEFGWKDPLFNKDAGFYVFRLPFWTFVVDWLFAAFVFALLLSMMAHYLNGSLRPELGSGLARSGARIHVSALLVVLSLLRAWAYWLDRYELVLSDRGGFTGAMATDVNIRLPAYEVLVLVALLGAVLFAVNATRSGWGLAVVAVGLWSITHLTLAGIYPALYQELRVEQARLAREGTFVDRNMEATLFAYRLDDEHLRRESLAYTSVVTDDDTVTFGPVLSDVAVVDAALTAPRFTRNQGEREYYAFREPLDIDRYRVGDDLEPVVLSVRAIDLERLPNESWENRHVVYTHGNGVVVAAADAVEDDGEPRFYYEGVGDETGPTVEGFAADAVEPYVYYSEGLSGYAIVGVDQVEYQDEAENLFNPVPGGEGGVRLDSTLRRAAYSISLGEVRLLFSDSITDETRILYHRDIRERVRHVAPFLRFDSDPYPALVDGRLLWLVDGYTTTNRFPYAERATPETLASSDLRGGYNYVRNSVKVTVDAFSGAITMYLVDPADPIAAAWDRALPDLFTPAGDAPDALRDHWRYPVDLFRIQTEMWSSYQAPNAARLIQGNLAWSVAREPAAVVATPSSGSASSPTSVPAAGPGSAASAPSTGQAGLMAPQYRVTVLPGEDQTEFVLQRAFVPRSGQDGATERSSLTAVMVARSDPEHYGELVLYRLPSGEVPAPELVGAEMGNAASEYITSLRSSKVTFGRMQLVLLDDNLLYVRSLYITDASGSGVPELTQVVVSDGERIVLAASVPEAVAALVEESGGPDPGVADDGSTSDGLPPDDRGEPGSSGEEDNDRPGGTTGQGDDDPSSGADPAVDYRGWSAAELVAEVDGLLAGAEDAEAAGDDATASQLRSRAREALRALEVLLGVAPDSRVDESGET